AAVADDYVVARATGEEIGPGATLERVVTALADERRTAGERRGVEEVGTDTTDQRGGFDIGEAQNEGAHDEFGGTERHGAVVAGDEAIGAAATVEDATNRKREETAGSKVERECIVRGRTVEHERRFIGQRAGEKNRTGAVVD